MRQRLSWILLLSAVFGFGQSKESKLTERDFVIGKLTSMSDSISVRRWLGRPDSVLVEENPLDPGAKLPLWFYKDVLVTFGSSGKVLGVWLQSPRYRTSRNVGVGAPESYLKGKYGNTTDDHDILEYSEDGTGGLHVLQFYLKNKKVSRIYVGWVLD